MLVAMADGNADWGDAKVVEEALISTAEDSEICERGDEDMTDVDVMATDIDEREDGEIDTTEKDETKEGSDGNLTTDVPGGAFVVPRIALIVGSS